MEHTAFAAIHKRGSPTFDVRRAAKEVEMYGQRNRSSASAADALAAPERVGGSEAAEGGIGGSDLLDHQCGLGNGAVFRVPAGAGRVPRLAAVASDTEADDERNGDDPNSPAGDEWICAGDDGVVMIPQALLR
jgi:hypothetical protein